LKALPELGRKFNIGLSNFTKNFREAMSTSLPAHLHSRDVLHSLRELREIEPVDGLVEVIFIPLFRAQQHAEELLIQIVFADQLLRLGETSLLEGYYADQIEGKRTEAKNIVKRISATVEGDLLFSNQSLVEAVMHFGQHYSEISKRAIFFSFSWITKRDDLHVVVPNLHYGFPIVAAGNEGIEWGGECDPHYADTVYEPRRLLVSRSLDPKDVIGVMNVQESGGPDCNSSVFDPNGSALALAYLGNLGDACGTSFSTPRVAWFFAAREAFRDYPQNGLYHLYKWRESVQNDVRKMHDPSQCAFNRIRFDPMRFFED
jgi:hypothetical protein